MKFLFLVLSFFNFSYAQDYFENSEYNDYFMNNIISRSQWKACSSKPGMKKELKKTKFAIHHSAGNVAPSYEVVKNIQHSHIHDKKWSDIGYHFLIDIDGNCFEGRDLNFQGAHVESSNKENIGICFLGYFDDNKNNFHLPKEAMFNKAGELIAVLSRKFSIVLSNESIKAHCKYKDAHTICPGNLILENMETILLKARQS